MRYFRSSVEVYVAACAALDAAYGYPNAETKTERALPVHEELPHDAQGRLYLAVRDEFCGYEAAAQLLPQLLASGAVEEIDAATYQAAVQPQEP